MAVVCGGNSSGGGSSGGYGGSAEGGGSGNYFHDAQSPARRKRAGDTSTADLATTGSVGPVTKKARKAAAPAADANVFAHQSGDDSIGSASKAPGPPLATKTPGGCWADD